jgi:hypothetical protein
MLLSHHISSAARQRILYELAHRTQQMMEGIAYSWYVKSNLYVPRSYVIQETNIPPHAKSCFESRKCRRSIPDQSA